MKLSLKRKMILSLSLLSTIPVLTLGIISYKISENVINDEIKSKLEVQVHDHKAELIHLLEAHEKDINATKNLAKSSVIQMTKNITHMYELWQSGDADESKLKQPLSRVKFGKNGYLFALDYEGNYVVSPGNKLNGKNILNVKDLTGRSFAKEMISTGKKLNFGDVSLIEYTWKDSNRDGVRKKIASILHIPELEWIVGISAYFDDLMDMDAKRKLLDRFKNNLSKIKVGKTGYLYIINSKGTLISHPDLEGQNISRFDFVKTIISNKQGFLKYKWKGEYKEVAYEYIKDLDYIIAAGIPHHEFTSPLSNMKNVLILIFILSMIISLVVAILFSNNISSSILKIIDQLTKGSTNNSTSAKQLSDASKSLSESSSSQASSIEETSASLEELTGIVSNNVNNSEKSSEMASNVLTMTEQGTNTMNKLVETTIELTQSTKDIQGVVQVINDIGDKTAIIDEIVFQTKLLSFNASVEAERAGEHGRGFAVVAQEVGKLAQISGTAASDISEIVRSSLERTEKITKTNIEKVKNAEKFVGEASEIIQEIEKNAEESAKYSKDILTSSKEQSVGISQINEAISKLDKNTQETASISEEAAVSSEKLNTQVEHLNTVISSLNSLLIGK